MNKLLVGNKCDLAIQVKNMWTFAKEFSEQLDIAFTKEFVEQLDIAFAKEFVEQLNIAFAKKFAEQIDISSAKEFVEQLDIAFVFVQTSAKNAINVEPVEFKNRVGVPAAQVGARQGVKMDS